MGNLLPMLLAEDIAFGGSLALAAFVCWVICLLGFCAAVTVLAKQYCQFPTSLCLQGVRAFPIGAAPALRRDTLRRCRSCLVRNPL